MKNKSNGPIFVLVVIFVLLMSFTGLEPYQCVIIFILVLVLYVIGVFFNKYYATVRIHKIDDPDRRIKEYEKLLSSEDSPLQKAIYVNNMSEGYYVKDEYEKALMLVREAREMYVDNSKKGQMEFGMPPMDIFDLNESRYLISLGFFEEASIIMLRLDEKRIKNSIYLCCLCLNRAELAIERGFSNIARNQLARLDELDWKQEKDAKVIEDSIVWVQMKCDVLDRNYTSATNCLNTIIESNPSERMKEKARKMKMEIENKRSQSPHA